MMKSCLVSIVIRTKNEEAWISHCLEAISRQTFVDYEIILIDNESMDRTVEIAREFGVQLLNINEFLPGKALNLGISRALGEYIVCLSGHCVPTNEFWLENLVLEFKDENVAGVYGRQVPLSYSTDLDKRDLYTVFGLDKKIQILDPFFHNANSAVRKSILETIPFDSQVTNVEDRIWGKNVIAAGYKIVYTPNAAVYHWHGINHDADPMRAKKVMGVLESSGVYASDRDEPKLQKAKFLFNCVVPLRKRDVEIIGLDRSVKFLEEVRHALPNEKIIVLTDDFELGEVFKSIGCYIPGIRNPDSSADFIDVLDVVSAIDSSIEKELGVFSHWLYLNANFPFRSWEQIKDYVDKFPANSFDSLLPVVSISHSLWTKPSETDNSSYEWEGSVPKSVRTFTPKMSLFGYGSILSREFVRSGRSGNFSIQFETVDSEFASLELTSKKGWDAISIFQGETTKDE
jgi:rhamnosyltransferase